LVGRDVVGREVTGREVVGREVVGRDVFAGCRVVGRDGCRRDCTTPVVFRRTVRFEPSEGRPVEPLRTAGWLGRVAVDRDDTGARRVGAERIAG
jgi:hypothetical protein